jgi:hypothetical protein
MRMVCFGEAMTIRLAAGDRVGLPLVSPARFAVSSFTFAAGPPGLLLKRR